MAEKRGTRRWRRAYAPVHITLTATTGLVTTSASSRSTGVSACSQLALRRRCPTERDEAGPKRQPPPLHRSSVPPTGLSTRGAAPEQLLLCRRLHSNFPPLR